MPTSPAIYLSAALCCASIASLHDIRTRRIPNLLTAPAIVAGLGLHLVLDGPAGFGWSALAALIGGGIFLIFFLAGGMGAGDVKLMTAVGALAGISFLRDVLIATVLVGAVMGVVLALYRGRLRETLGNVGTLVAHHGAEGLAAHADLHVANPATLRLPYALPIAAGCLIAFALASGKAFPR